MFVPAAPDDPDNADRVSPVALRLGSDDGRKVWLNGELLHEDGNIQGLAPDRLVSVPLSLDSGWNRVVAKIAQGAGRWEFIARIECRDPLLLEGLGSALQPEE